MLRDNDYGKRLRTFLCLGALGVASQVSANPFMMGQSVAYSSEQWPDRWSSALSPAPIQSVVAENALTPYQPVQKMVPYYNPYSQTTGGAPYYGFNERQVVRPWGELPRKTRNTKRKQRYKRDRQRLQNRYQPMAYPQVLPISNPYMNSFPYAGGLFPGVSPVMGAPGLISPYGVAPLGGLGAAWPVAPGLW